MSEDLAGRTTGILTAIREVVVQDGRWKRAKWLCRCRCGREVTIRATALVARRQFSCGCILPGRAKLFDSGKEYTFHLARFLKRIENPNERGCRLWTGRTNNKGYGYLSCRIDNKHGHMTAHRIAWLIAGRSFTPGLELRHRCNVPLCTTVEHLEEGSRLDNMADMAMSGRARRSSLPLGVRCRKNGFSAYFYPGGKAVRVGYFSTPEEAAAAARSAKEAYYLNERGWTPPTFTT